MEHTTPVVPALTDAQRMDLEAIETLVPRPGLVNGNRLRWLAAKGLVSLERRGTGRDTWTAAMITDRGLVALGRPNAVVPVAELGQALDRLAAGAVEHDGLEHTAALRDGIAARFAELEGMLVLSERGSAAMGRDLDRFAARIQELEAQLQRTESARAQLAQDLTATQARAGRLESLAVSIAREAGVYPPGSAATSPADGIGYLGERIIDLENGLPGPCCGHHEVTCPACGTTIRARMADAVGAETPGQPETARVPIRPASVGGTESGELAPEPTRTARQMLGDLGVPAIQGLIVGEEVQVRDVPQLRAHEPARTRVLGTLANTAAGERLMTDSSTAHPPVVAVDLISAYVDAVRAAGFPAPQRRRALLVAVIREAGR